MNIQSVQLGTVSVDLVRKDIKNVHLSVHPPTGRVRIAAPLSMATSTVRLFAVAKIDWIKKQQRKLQSQEREPAREYLEREGHYLWGRRLLLRVAYGNGPRRIEATHSALLLHAHRDDTVRECAATVARFYRQQVRDEAAPLIEQWNERLDVDARSIYVQQMRTKWGSCNPSARTIRLNTELAKKPRECLEYVVIHELAHLLDATHGRRFVGLLDRHLPQWRVIRDALNALPVRYEPAWTDEKGNSGSLSTKLQTSGLRADRRLLSDAP